MQRFYSLLILCSCTTARPVYLSADEPDSVTFATLDAIDFWNDVAGYDALVVHSIPHAEIGFLHPGAIVVLSRREVAGSDTYHTAETDAYGGARILVERSAFAVDADHLEYEGQGSFMVAHELGHALGLAHHDNPANLMYPWNYASDNCALTRDQRRRVRTVLIAGKLLAH